jgi:predicted transcriptional regulator
MADSNEIYSEILKIKTDVRALQHQTSWLLLGQAHELEKQWQPAFGLISGKKANFTAMRVYLAVNGKRTVTEIGTEADVHQPDASKILAALERVGLVEPVPQKTSGTKIYAKTSADWALGISKTLQARLAQKAASPSNKSSTQNSE